MFFKLRYASHIQRKEGKNAVTQSQCRALEQWVRGVPAPASQPLHPRSPSTHHSATARGPPRGPGPDDPPRGPGPLPAGPPARGWAGTAGRAPALALPAGREGARRLGLPRRVAAPRAPRPRSRARDPPHLPPSGTWDAPEPGAAAKAETSPPLPPATARGAGRSGGDPASQTRGRHRGRGVEGHSPSPPAATAAAAPARGPSCSRASSHPRPRADSPGAGARGRSRPAPPRRRGRPAHAHAHLCPGLGGRGGDPARAW